MGWVKWPSGPSRRSSSSGSRPESSSASCRRPGPPAAHSRRGRCWILERDVVDMMRAGQNSQSAIREVTETDLAKTHPDLTEHQRAAVSQILANRDQMTALEGIAGAGKRPPSRPSVPRPSVAATALKGSRRPPARRRSWARPASRRRRYSCTSPAPRVCRPARSGSTSSTNRVWRARSRCTHSFTACAQRIACSWSVTCVNTRLSMPGDRINSSRRRAWQRPGSRTSCARETQP